MAAAPVVVFSDFVCPFSYVTERALRRLQAEGLASPEYRAFELYPAPAPLPLDEPADWEEALRPLAEAEGVEMRPQALRCRTRKAHEAAYFAEAKGAGGAMRDALFAAYFRDGRDIGRIDVLVELGTGVGLDASELKVVLDVDGFTAAVMRDQASARRAGVTGTPTLVVGAGTEARALVGAQPYDVLRETLVEMDRDD